jgi:anti-sigma regulatory factor (Ser/Thr protein kinase)
LINNAVEALESDVGEVTVNCFADSKFCMIAVTDNGKGIPPEILERIFDKGFSFGKERTQQAGGSGLGLAHARETLRRIDGRIEINSKVDVGTQVVVTLPRAEAPAWFLSSLDLTRGSKVVVLDDDDSIHEVWRARLGMDVEVLSFFDAQLLVEAHQRGLRADRYLIDYELLNQKWNGLQVIRTLEIQDYAVLVTSHLEVDVVAVCLDTSIKLLPKSMAKDVPLALQDSAAQIR